MAKPEDKEYSAHLTLARLRFPDRSTVDKIQRVIERESRTAFGNWDVAEIQLIRSELGGNGSTYSIVASFTLSEGASLRLS
jgi:2'-5' RNA ligase